MRCPFRASWRLFRPGFWPVLLAAWFAGACTDRMAPSEDRWSRSGELIAMSGGEAGARYACISCHGARGEGNGFDAPRLAGLPAGYLQKQMEDYATGLRPHAVMRDVARFLDSHERVRVADYYAARPAVARRPATADRANTAAAADMAGTAAMATMASTADSTDTAKPPALARYASACQSCHGSAGEGTPLGPPLAGQPAFYLAQQLQDWQVAKRRNDGRHEMLKVAQGLSPEEVQSLSRLLARMPIPSLPPPAVR